MACYNSNDTYTNSENAISVKNTRTVLTDLLPYSRYLLIITAVGDMEGKPVSFYQNTTETGQYNTI